MPISPIGIPSLQLSKHIFCKRTHVVVLLRTNILDKNQYISTILFLVDVCQRHTTYIRISSHTCKFQTAISTELPTGKPSRS